MRIRLLKWLSLIVGGLASILVVGVGVWVVTEQRAFERVNVTAALLRDGRYDPSEHFKFDRACTFPPEGSGYELLEGRGYRSVDTIYLPDTFTHWSLTLINDSDKSYRTLYVVDPVVKSAGFVCHSKITLRTEISEGHVRAYVEEARKNE